MRLSNIVVFFTLVAVIVPGLARADEFVLLTGDEIEATLDDTTWVYDGGAVQTFYASGRTLYNAGQDSWGSWRDQGDRYCSEWPPNAGWDCYSMDSDGTVVRFISERGHVTVGRPETQ